MQTDLHEKTRLRLAYNEIGTIHTFLVETAYFLQFEKNCYNNAVCSKMVDDLSKEIGKQIARKSSDRPFVLSQERVLKIKQCVQELKEMIQNERFRTMDRSLVFLDVLQEKSKKVDKIIEKMISAKSQ
jgi:hypothetical protein